MRKKLFLNINNPIRLIHIALGLFLFGVFIKTIYSQILNSYFEHDFLWLIPTVIRETEGLSPWRLFIYFLNPMPLWWGVPSLRIYVVSILSLFGPLARYFIFVSVLFHGANSVLLFYLARQFSLSLRASLFSALAYLTLFAHFHAYMWPMAFQHLIVVFFILLVLNFYLKTESLTGGGRNFSLWYILTLVLNLFASFCRASILMLPAMILTHILFCSKNSEARSKKYDMWLPLFVTYLFYPLVTFSFGDPRLFMFLHEVGIPVFVKFLIMFLVGLGSLFMLSALLRMHQRYNLIKKLKLILPITLIVTFIILLKIGGPKRFLIPYNFIVPFIGIFTSFIHPLQNVLLIDSMRPYHFLPLQIDPATFIMVVLMLIIFIGKFILKNRPLIILAGWYCFTLGYLYLRNPVVSRYFIYLSPVFCIVFCAVLDYLYIHLISSIKLKVAAKEAIVALVFVSLCLSNLMAIKLSLFKGRLVNTFMTYDYIRAANLIKPTKDIYLNNVMPIIFCEMPNFSVSDSKNDNARFVFMQVSNDSSLDVKINQAFERNNTAVYFLNGERVEDARDNNLSPFSRLFDEAKDKLKANQHKEALDLFIRAKKERPYLFNYVLEGFKADDLPWITNGNDMRTWVDKIACFYYLDSVGKEVERTKYLSAIMNKEIDDYIQCIFCLSYLEYTSGNMEESKYAFSTIRFLESDAKRLIAYLSNTPLIKRNDSMLSFLNDVGNISLCNEFNDYANRYKFEKFLFDLFKI